MGRLLVTLALAIMMIAVTLPVVPGVSAIATVDYCGGGIPIMSHAKTLIFFLEPTDLNS